MCVRLPQPRRDGQRAQREDDHEHREAVQFGVELEGPARMLIVWIAGFAGRSTVQRRHEHAVVVHQAQRAAAVDQDIAVLQVAVRDPQPTQLVDQLDESSLDVRQRARLGQAVFDRAIQWPAFEPRHLGNRVPGLSDTHAGVEILNRYQGSGPQARQRVADRRVARRSVGGLAMKAAHRPLVPAGAQLIGHREIAGHRARQPKVAGR